MNENKAYRSLRLDPTHSPLWRYLMALKLPPLSFLETMFLVCSFFTATAFNCSRPCLSCGTGRSRLLAFPCLGGCSLLKHARLLHRRQAAHMYVP